MSIRRLTSVAAAAAFTTIVLVPNSAFAADAYHPANGESGATYHPDHASTASSQQVAADLLKAQQHPAWNTAISRGAPWPVAKTGEPKTREQVNAELNAAMQHPAWKNVSRGAPWPTVVADKK